MMSLKAVTIFIRSNLKWINSEIIVSRRTDPCINFLRLDLIASNLIF